MTALLIPLAQLPLAWPVLWPLLERAARRTPGMPDVRAVIESGDAQLWAIVEDDGHPIAAVATQVTLLPEKRCRLWLVGGWRLAEWAPLFLAALEPWARALGCAAIWGTRSRGGWARIVRRLGGDRIDTTDGTPAWGRRL